MDKKEQLQSLLDSLSPEQIEELQSLLQKSSVTSRDTKKKKRRGKRRRKRREAAKAREEQQKLEYQQKEEAPGDEDFLEGLRLTVEEKKQLEEASKSDKEMGAHEPRERPVKVKKGDNKVEMRWRVCGKTEKVSPGLVPPEKDRFKCNACCCSAG